MEIEGIKENEYTFNYKRITFNDNEAEFLLKINFENSFNNNPVLQIKFNNNIIDD